MYVLESSANSTNFIIVHVMSHFLLPVFIFLSPALIFVRRNLLKKGSSVATIASYNAGVVKIHNAVGSLVRCENKNIFLLL
jgi:hypothetical protein